MLQKSEVDLIQNKYHEITRHYKESYLETVKPERRTCQPNYEDTITQAYRSLTPGLHKVKKTKYCFCACIGKYSYQVLSYSCNWSFFPTYYQVCPKLQPEQISIAVRSFHYWLQEPLPPMAWSRSSAAWPKTMTTLIMPLSFAMMLAPMILN